MTDLDTHSGSPFIDKFEKRRIENPNFVPQAPPEAYISERFGAENKFEDLGLLKNKKYPNLIEYMLEQQRFLKIYYTDQVIHGI